MEEKPAAGGRFVSTRRISILTGYAYQRIYAALEACARVCMKTSGKFPNDVGLLEVCAFRGLYVT